MSFIEGKIAQFVRSDFSKSPTEDFDLNIIGLMCIPPFDEDPTNYFKEMSKLNKDFGPT